MEGVWNSKSIFVFLLRDGYSRHSLPLPPVLNTGAIPELAGHLHKNDKPHLEDRGPSG